MMKMMQMMCVIKIIHSLNVVKTANIKTQFLKQGTDKVNKKNTTSKVFIYFVYYLTKN